MMTMQDCYACGGDGFIESEAGKPCPYCDGQGRTRARTLGEFVWVPIDWRRDACTTPVTLDGKPATISGAVERFATVRALDGSACAEYAWPTVRRILALREGRFTTT